MSEWHPGQGHREPYRPLDSHVAQPSSPEPPSDDGSKVGQGWVWVGLGAGALVVLIVIGALVSSSGDDSDQRTAGAASTEQEEESPEETETQEASPSPAEESTEAPTEEPTEEPTAEPTPEPTPEEEFLTFGAGTQIVGTDIFPGTYRAPGGSGCYFERLSGFGGTTDDIITNDFGSSLPVVTISESDAGFNSNDCGEWTTDLPIGRGALGAPFEDGTFIVGVDIEAGTWRAEGGDGCYFERLSGFGGTIDDIITNEFGAITPIVEIASSDAGFSTSGCGQWSKVT